MKINKIVIECTESCYIASYVYDIEKQCQVMIPGTLKKVKKNLLPAYYFDEYLKNLQ